MYANAFAIAGFLGLEYPSKETGLTLDNLKTMEPAKVEALFYPPENLRQAKKPIPMVISCLSFTSCTETFSMKISAWKKSQCRSSGFLVKRCTSIGLGMLLIPIM